MSLQKAQGVKGDGDRGVEDPPEVRILSPGPVPDGNGKNHLSTVRACESICHLKRQGKVKKPRMEAEAPLKVPPKVRPPSMELVVYDNGETLPADITAGTVGQWVPAPVA